MASLTAERLREVGSFDFYGYRIIGVDSYSYGAHRLAVLYMTGRRATDRVDHINGKPGDDRWENLRECSHSDNQKNMKRHKDNFSGFKGVYTATKGRSWFSQIMSDGKIKYLGSFSTKEEAAAAYDCAAAEMHGQFARLNEAA